MYISLLCSFNYFCSVKYLIVFSVKGLWDCLYEHITFLTPFFPFPFLSVFFAKSPVELFWADTSHSLFLFPEIPRYITLILHWFLYILNPYNTPISISTKTGKILYRLLLYLNLSLVSSFFRFIFTSDHTVRLKIVSGLLETGVTIMVGYNNVPFSLKRLC